MYISSVSHHHANRNKMLYIKYFTHIRLLFILTFTYFWCLFPSKNNFLKEFSVIWNFSLNDTIICLFLCLKTSITFFFFFLAYWSILRCAFIFTWYLNHLITQKPLSSSSRASRLKIMKLFSNYISSSENLRVPPPPPPSHLIPPNAYVRTSHQPQFKVCYSYQVCWD